MAMNMDAVLRITANVQGQDKVDRLDRSFGTLKGSATTAAGGLKSLSSGVSALGSALASAAVVGGIRNIMDVFGSYQEDILLLENGLKNLGGTAPQEIEKLKTAASKLGEVTLFNEEDFNKGFGLLTSFTNISVGSYERVATAAADLAQTSGTNVSSAMIQLAKAVNDPVAGLTALGRAGVQFSNEQKELIKSMVEVGNVAGAQELVLSELERQYGGNATAAAQGYAGAIDTLGEKFYDLKKAIGPLIETALVPLISLLSEAVSFLAERIVPILTALPAPLQVVIGGFGALGVAITALLPIVALLGPGLIQVGAALSSLSLGATIAGWAGAIGPAIAAMSAALSGFLAFLSGTFIPAVLAFFSGPAGWTVLAIAAVVGMVIAFREPIMEFLSWMWENFTQAMGQLGSLLYDVFIQPWINLWEMVKEPVIAVFDWLRGVAETVFSAIIAIGWQLFVQPWINLWDSIKEPVGDAWEAIKAYAEEGWNWIVKTTHKIFVQPWINLWENVLREPITTAWDWIKKTWKTIVTFWEDKVTKPIKDAWSWLMTSIKTAFDVGMQQVGSAFKAWVKSFVDPINWVIREVNKLVSAFNVLAEATGNPFRITSLPEIPVPAFAEGGYVRRPMLAMVGEGSQPEYIIPESKMAAASANYLAGSRGADVIPTATPSRAGSGAAPIINIRTGKVVEFDGQRYVSMQDFERGLRQVSEGVIGRLRTPAARAALGMR